MNRRRKQGERGDALRGSEQARQAGDRAFGPPPEGPQWPGREPCEAERSGVPATDMEARTPLGVGTSMSRRNDKAARRAATSGRHTRGRSGRPIDRPSGDPSGGPAGATGTSAPRVADERAWHMH